MDFLALAAAEPALAAFINALAQAVETYFPNANASGKVSAVQAGVIAAQGLFTTLTPVAIQTAQAMASAVVATNHATGQQAIAAAAPAKS